MATVIAFTAARSRFVGAPAASRETESAQGLVRRAGPCPARGSCRLRPVLAPLADKDEPAAIPGKGVDPEHPEQAPRLVSRPPYAPEIFGRGQIGARGFRDPVDPADVEERPVAARDLFGRREKPDVAFIVKVRHRADAGAAGFPALDCREVVVDVLKHLAADERVIGGAISRRVGRVADKKLALGVSLARLLDRDRAEVEPVIAHPGCDQHLGQHAAAAADFQHSIEFRRPDQFADFCEQWVIRAGARPLIGAVVVQIHVVVVVAAARFLRHHPSRRAAVSSAGAAPPREQRRGAPATRAIAARCPRPAARRL